MLFLISQIFYVDSEEDEEDEEASVTMLTATAASHLFGLLHQRYIITPTGLSAMVTNISDER